MTNQKQKAIEGKGT